MAPKKKAQKPSQQQRAEDEELEASDALRCGCVHLVFFDVDGGGRRRVFFFARERRAGERRAASGERRARE